MTVQKRGVNKSQTGKSKKPTFKKKGRSVPSLIKKNRRDLKKLKHEESSAEDDSASSDLDVDDDTIQMVTSNNRSDNHGESASVSDSDESDSNILNSSDKEDAVDLFNEIEHKKSLSKLKETDPEFYRFLEENDKKLLQFDVSGSDSEVESEDDKVHQPPRDLEVDSDEDDFTEGEEWKGSSGRLITLALVSEWQNQLQSKVDVSVVTDVVKGFQAALQTVSESEKAGESEFRVDGSSVFNAVVQLCVVELQPALLKLLNIRSHSTATTQLSRSKRWTKVKGIVKSYITDLLKLLEAVSSANILTVLLKHLHQMTVFFGYFHSLTRAALKQLVALWSTSTEEMVRVIAFLCILRLTTNQQKSLLDTVLKMMYVSFISNSKFVSVSTLPNLTFMRRSLAELFALDATVSYQHAFLYIRQLAIHLRNAITVHKKESIQAVCNWQYLNSLRLWTDLISSTDAKSPLRALLYPLVQVIIGCVKLVPMARYLPLRFHCCRLLAQLSKETATYIPVLPFIVESLTLTEFTKKHTKVSMKPLDLTCVLRVSNTALAENGFKEAVVEQVYQLLIEYCANESHRISFPDLIVPSLIQLRKFVRECHTPKYSQKFRQALAKLEETAKFVEAERRCVSVSLGDMKGVDAWEERLRARGTPLTTFYNSWHKVHQRQQAKRATDNDKLGDFKLPQIIKKPADHQKSKPTSGPVELFPSDSDNDDSIHFGDDEKQRVKRVKKTKKPKQLQQPIIKDDVEEESESDNEIEDIVEELKLSDLD